MAARYGGLVHYLHVESASRLLELVIFVRENKLSVTLPELPETWQLPQVHKDFIAELKKIKKELMG